MPESKNRAPILYVSDLSADLFDPADLFDLAFVLQSHEKFALMGVVLPENDMSGTRTLDLLAVRSPDAGNIIYHNGADGFKEALHAASEPLNVVAVAGFASLAAVLRSDRALFREKVARLFLVGGHANDYTVSRAVGEQLPIDPRLKERHPERFAPGGDLRLRSVASPPAPGEWGGGGGGGGAGPAPPPHKG
ncbi:MAG: hypothetical protein H7145_25320, partial [Akkermansiaceae bacterium]|nr:hypothetical protein [Armatimonadota bacterium]